MFDRKVAGRKRRPPRQIVAVSDPGGAKKALGAVALVLIGAVLGVVVPRVAEKVWPADKEVTDVAIKQTVPEVAIVSHQNNKNWYTYFQKEPDWVAMNNAYNACDRTSASPLFSVGGDDCRVVALAKFGGVGEFGFSFVDVTNAQSSSVQITEVRAVVDKRTRATFAAKYEPPIGGPLGKIMVFNLDRPSSRAVLWNDEERPVTDVLKASPPPFFSQHHWEIPPGRTESFSAVPVSSFNGILEWHLEVSYEAQDPSGKVVSVTKYVTPPGEKFKGVPPHMKAHVTKEQMVP